MHPTGPKRLDREKFVEAGLELSRAEREGGPVQVTGATLGRLLRADRSAVWRHFADREDLLEALHDRMLTEVLESTLATRDPWGRVATAYESLIEHYRGRPILAHDTSGISPRGESWRRLADVLVGTFMELGLDAEAAAGYFRLFFEMATSYAIALASYEMRPRADQLREMEATKKELQSFDPAEHPHLHAAAPYLEAMTQNQVTDRILGLLRGALDGARLATSSGVPLR